MENREKHRLEKLYVHETQRFLQQLHEGAGIDQLEEQKRRILELSRQLDRERPVCDPSAAPLRRHRYDA